MNLIPITVTNSGSVSPNSVVLGHVGEHNVTTIIFTVDQTLIESVDYFRIDFGGILTEKLYAGEDREVRYDVSQSVLTNGSTIAQLEGIKITDGKVSILFKSDIIKVNILYSVSCCREMPKEAHEPFENAVAELENLLQNAEQYEGSLVRAESAAKLAETSAQDAVQANETATSAAERAVSCAESAETSRNEAIQSAETAMQNATSAVEAASESVAARDETVAARDEAISASTSAVNSSNNASVSATAAELISRELKRQSDALDAVCDIFSILPQETVEKVDFESAQVPFNNESYIYTNPESTASSTIYRYVAVCDTVLVPNANYKITMNYLDFTQIGSKLVVSVGELSNVVANNIDIFFDTRDYQHITAEFRTGERMVAGAPVYLIFYPESEFRGAPETVSVLIEKTSTVPTANTVGTLLDERNNTMLVYENTDPAWEAYRVLFPGQKINDNIEIIKGLRYKVELYCDGEASDLVYFTMGDNDETIIEMSYNVDKKRYECSYIAQEGYSKESVSKIGWMSELGNINSGRIKLICENSVMEIVGDIYSKLSAFS